MPAIGFGMLWSGYTLLFWGWCKVKGYDITLSQIVIPKAFKGTWPPPLVNDGGTSTGSTVKNAPGSHAGDMPGTWGTDPNYGGPISDPGGASGGGVIQA